MIKLKKGNNEARIMIDEVDKATHDQISQFLEDPSFANPIAIMPDCHYGKGAVIGFTMEMTDRIIPNVVGVDISCGVLAAVLDTDFFNNFDKNKFDRDIRSAIPMGNRVHKAPIHAIENYMDWGRVSSDIMRFTNEFNLRYRTNFEYGGSNYYQQFVDLCNKVGCDPNYAACSVGTMGGGNHFIEFGRDEGGRTWVLIHSGSRNLGKRIADYWQKIAAEKADEVDIKAQSVAIEEIKSNYPKEEWHTRIVASKAAVGSQFTKGLEYLAGRDMYDYLVDCIFAHHYAMANRYMMLRIVMDTSGGCTVEHATHTVHNYVSHEDFIIRKGAVSARAGEIFVLPFNLEDGTFICRGRGNSEWNYSAPHGAGRVYSRRQAKKELSVEAARNSLRQKGILTTVLPADELPLAYKSAKQIEEAILPTAEILHRIKPIISFKTNK